MPGAGRVVEDFIAAWNRMDFDSVIAALADQVRYHNMPMDEVCGVAAVRDYLLGAWRFDECRWTTHHLAVADNIVLTEREDAFRFAGGWVRLPVMGTFQVEAGRISHWRDYFDLADYRRQLAAVTDK